MEQNIKSRLLESIGKVYESAKGCKLEAAFFDEVKPEVGLIEAYFGINEIQSLIVAIVFSLNYKGCAVTFNQLIEYFECNPMRLLGHNDDFNQLFEKGIINKDKSRYGLTFAISKDELTINEKITEAILNNKPLPNLKDAAANVFEVIENLSRFWRERDGYFTSLIDLRYQVNETLQKYAHFPLIQLVADQNLDEIDAYIYLLLIWDTLNGRDCVNLMRVLDDVYDLKSEQIQYAQKLITGEHPFITLDLIELVESGFFNDTEIRLSERSFEMIDAIGIRLITKTKVNRSNIFDPTAIISKTLYFNENESKQIETLTKILQEENFKEAQIRLVGKGLPTGITALLHGFPGTGKTETAFQLAKETNREIVKVDISQSKSMWFGESEKIIKRLFTNYKRYAKDCERKPILLFNEADAIISKRKDIGLSNTDQTENTIQNILLEELERFDGIFIATTNLVKNLDSAFERRFLFKIEFLKPEISVKAKIWQSKLPRLTEMECEMLAERFDFSGGQIDNIIRKNEIYEIIHGMSVDFTNIVSFCQTELLHKNSGFKVGFTNT
jgi:hypothetical protein